MSERVKITIEAERAELMTGYRAASDFLDKHAHEGRATVRQCVVTRWKWHDDSRTPVFFAAWGDAQHVRVKQETTDDPR